MGDRRTKDELFDAFALVAKALASGRRAEIIDVLAQAPRSVEEIANEIEQSVANTSHHLRVLARAGMVRAQRQGTRMIYAVASERVGDLWRALRDVAASQVAEVERLARAYLGDRDGLQPMSRDELAKLLRRKDVIVLDVRPRVEFEAGHIAGARSLPITELTERLRSLPKDSRIVAYCRGRYCVFADEAVRVLRKRGYDAVRLEDGFPEWHDERRPVGKHPK